MSEPKGPFDAAISILNLTHFRTDIHPNVQKIIDVAIRVLEAAGKVDKKKDKKYIPRNVSKYLIIRCFDCAWSSGNYTGICDYSASCASAKECAAFKKQVRTLLASLPEKE